MCRCILVDKIVHDKHNNRLHCTRVKQNIMPGCAQLCTIMQISQIVNYAQLCTIMHNYAQLCTYILRPPPPRPTFHVEQWHLGAGCGRALAAGLGRGLGVASFSYKSTYKSGGVCKLTAKGASEAHCTDLYDVVVLQAAVQLQLCITHLVEAGLQHNFDSYPRLAAWVLGAVHHCKPSEPNLSLQVVFVMLMHLVVVVAGGDLR